MGERFRQRDQRGLELAADHRVGQAVQQELCIQRGVQTEEADVDTGHRPAQLSRCPDADV